MNSEFDKVEQSQTEGTQKENNKKICCLCTKKIRGYGNNASPLINDGICCDSCNNTVIMHRLMSMKRRK